MMDELQNLKNKKLICTLLLVIIIAFQLANIIYTFSVKKTGENADEVWSYGLANSYYEPYIFADDHRDERSKYHDEWIDGSELKDYVTVREDQRFTYASTIYNLKCDEHPPLWFLILHTICSFFPGQYSPWFGFAINIVCFAITMLFLYRLVLKHSKSSVLALLAVLFFGFSGGGVTLYIFVRHYAMAAMFVLMMIYYHYVLAEKEQARNNGEQDVSKKGTLLMIFISSAFAMLSLYLSVVPAFVIAASFCLLYFLKKQYKDMFVYAGVMLASVVPVSVLSGIFSDKITMEGINTNERRPGIVGFLKAYPGKIKTLIDSLLKDLFGYGLPQNPDYTIKFFLSTTLLIAVLLIPVIILLKRNGMIKLGESLRERKERNKNEGRVRLREKPEKWIFITCILIILFEAVAVTGLSVFKEIGGAISRYMFVLYPLLAFVLTVAFYAVIKKILVFFSMFFGKKIYTASRAMAATAVITILAAIMLHDNYEMVYLFPRDDNEVQIEDLTKGKSCALFLSEHWLLTSYADLLMDASEVYVGETGNSGSVMKLTEGHELPDYVIVDVENYIQHSFKAFYSQERLRTEETRKEFEELFMADFDAALGGAKLEFVENDEIFTRHVIVYGVKRLS